MSLRKDFREFVFRGNVVDLAIAVIVGGAFGKIVTALVEDLVMPFVGIVLPSGQWREWVWSPIPSLHLKIGHFVGSVIDFLIIAFAIFLVLVKIVGTVKNKIDPAKAVTKTCPECMEIVAIGAKRCKFCTSQLATT
jgi:large conductance mechanosensitive channel